MNRVYYHLGPIGAMVRKINTDGTLEDAFLVYTYDGLKKAPTPTNGYPTYQYDESKWPEIRTYFTSLGNRPPSHGGQLAQNYKAD